MVGALTNCSTFVEAVVVRNNSNGLENPRRQGKATERHDEMLLLICLA
jgi:hypothetical protein